MFFALFMVVVSFVITSPAAELSTRSLVYPWGLESTGLLMKVCLEKHTFKFNETINFICFHKSISPMRMAIWDSNFWPNHIVRLLDEKGTEVQRTGLGQKTLKAFSPGGERMKNVEVILEPGETDQGFPFTLNKYFAIERGGLYSLQVTFEEYQPGIHAYKSWMGKCWSNIVIFEVQSPDSVNIGK
jgi:hypothetical protein